MPFGRLSVKHLLLPLAIVGSSWVAQAQVATAHRTGGMLLGVQAWTFNQYTVFEAIQKASEAGSTNIELFPGQTLGSGFDSVKVGPEMGSAAVEGLQTQLKKYGVNIVAYGVTGIDKDETGARKLFQWAKTLGIGILNTESTESIDTIEKMVKEFDIRVGFHNHPKTNNPAYKMWDPTYIYQLVKDHDKRIGSCADTGHWVRSGLKPVDAIRALKGRIVSSHLKDLNEFSPNGHDVPYGTGISDLTDILNEYHKMGYQGTLSVEYEYHWDTSLPEVAQCLGFVRGYFAKK